MGADSILRVGRDDPATARSSRTGNRLYAWGAAVALLIILAGFGRTFYLRGVFGGPALSALLLVHGVVMTSWFVVFIAQVGLVGAGWVRAHRRLGTIGLAVAILVVIMGTATAIDAGRRGSSPAEGIGPLMFMAIPLFDMPMFAILAGSGLWMRNRPDFHKRLMLLATLSLLTPGIGRIPLDLIQQGGPPVFFALALLIVAMAVGIDTLKNRRLHPAFFWGGALIFFMLPLRLLVATSDAWHEFAGWLVS